MPYMIKTRKVSVAVWYKPWTWGKYRTEWKRVWDMNTRLRPDEVALFIKDQMLWGWREDCDLHK